MPRAAKLKTLKKRFARPRPSERKSPSGPRVQKNLSIIKSDAQRITALAKRDQVSQAQLLADALDAYEHCHGALTPQVGKS